MSHLELFADIKKNNTKTKCLILGCGPSLNEITKEKVKELSKDHVIATIKQSYLEFGDYSDFQFFNCNNICHYERSKAKFVCCSPTKPSNGWWGEQEIDLFYHMSKHPTKMIDIEDLNEFFLQENMGKYWGPGIMLEIILPLVYNLGVKEIITAGWDAGVKGSATNEHYYPSFERCNFRNPAHTPYKGEYEEVIKNSERINSFLTSKGISLKCVKSEKCFMHKSIERISL
jgi:hypothetical protein